MPTLLLFVNKRKVRKVRSNEKEGRGGRGRGRGRGRGKGRGRGNEAGGRREGKREGSTYSRISGKEGWEAVIVSRERKGLVLKMGWSLSALSMKKEI